MTTNMQKATTVECANCGAKNRVPSVADGVPRCARCSTPLRWVVDTTDEEFRAVADESSLPVLVDVWAPWCGPCRMVSPALEKLAGELAGKLKLVKVNADDNPEVGRRFEVQSIPTLVLLSRGEVVDKKIGALPEHQLRSWLESVLPNTSS
ncbi:thioredoxin [Nocardioides sp.]|uniref:thioredoxin n=1 Tax=Nocardioides sp. TaxID=35761 RepID=UPI002637882C|nr:thioredoxin [Nocardioides sp.]MCW2735741.1 thioredoxin [Nocardioides sp.]